MLKRNEVWKAVVLGMIAAAITVVMACGGDSTNSKASGAPQASTTPSAQSTAAAPSGGQTANGHPLLNFEQLSDIQPGLGTVMIEYNTRMQNAWFAAQAGNWDMALYQFKEMKEIQEVGETTRPKRVDALKKFETDQLDPLVKTAQDKDLSAFTEQYPRTLNGCNSCHKKTSDAAFPMGYYFVKIVKPTDPATKNIDWAGQEAPPPGSTPSP